MGISVLGEVGLTGEVRAVSHVETRLREMRKMGFDRCILPASSLKRTSPMDGMALMGAGNVEEAVEMLFEG